MTGLEFGYDYEKIANINKPAPTITAQGRGQSGFRIDFMQERERDAR